MNLLADSRTDLTDNLKIRRPIMGSHPTIFTDIYQDDTNIVIWQREHTANFQNLLSEFLTANSNFQSTMTVSPQTVLSSMSKELGDSEVAFMLSEDIAELVDMFCCLFELERAGLRLTALDKAMCPRYHVDKIPCRLVTTYHGIATEWIPHNQVDRTKLGRGNQGKSDDQSGLYQSPNDIHQLTQSDVALLKGEMWEGNENAGLVHRSPSVIEGDQRLLLTLDFN